MNGILDTIFHAIDQLIRSAQPYNGFIPSLLDCTTGKMLKELPAPIPGQRNGDRALAGSNLMHDHPLLKTMYALAKTEGKAEYEVAADRYLRYFATHCTDTASGLFPWGEHAFWHLTQHRVGSGDPAYDAEQRAIHDHLRQAPLWLWDKLHRFNPDCVQRFADGLTYHWTTRRPCEYIRHAEIASKERYDPAERSCDFPRHSGFYILDLAYAYTKGRRQETFQNLIMMMDYWWEKRDSRGLLLIESRSPSAAPRFRGIYSPSQTVSLAASLLESAECLHEVLPEVSEVMRIRAGVYIQGFLAAPHEPAKGRFANLCDAGCRLTENMSIWGSVYGISLAASTALVCLCAWRLCRESGLLAWAEAVGQCYLVQPFPISSRFRPGSESDIIDDNSMLSGHHFVPAGDAGLALELLADLYDITGERRWLDGGLHLADRFIAIYFDTPIPRGAAGNIHYYDSQMNPGNLIHGMARIAVLARDGPNCGFHADYTVR